MGISMASLHLRNFTSAISCILPRQNIPKVAVDVRSVWDLEKMCVTALTANKALLVELFQACGRKELQFVVQSGLWLGGTLGLFQMAVRKGNAKLMERERERERKRELE